MTYEPPAIESRKPVHRPTVLAGRLRLLADRLDDGYRTFAGKMVTDELREAADLLAPVGLDPCEAIIRHGPGRQSTTRCQVRGPHTEHWAPDPMCPGWDWTTDVAYVDDWGRVNER